MQKLIVSPSVSIDKEETVLFSRELSKELLYNEGMNPVRNYEETYHMYCSEIVQGRVTGSLKAINNF